MLVRLVILNIWKYLDPIYFSFTRLQYLCPDRKGEGVFRVRLTKYKGKEVLLSDGIMICKNDLLLKIHLHNVRLMQDFSYIKNELSKGRGVFRRVMNSMPLLAEFIDNHPEKSKIKGIIGITLINKGFRPLGFECVLPESKLYSWFKKTSQIPIYLLTCSKISIAHIKKHHPVYLMMSKERLMEKYKRTV
ncbi:YkoP family protein [Bacillus sp. 03113]|uniref:YkoP family protein n=1 Tax=Bacillus sp. 03113 TaxID=2578211 RepID=UPI001144A265|nr:hypothetical protein [Bacillus sp. 03113]